MDFLKIKRHLKTGKKNDDQFIDLYPDFIVCRSKDIMIRGGKFYAIWDHKNNIWSLDEYKVQSLVDEELRRIADKIHEHKVVIKTMSEYSTQSWSNFKAYCSKIGDNMISLDQQVSFKSEINTKEQYRTKHLHYDLIETPCPNYDKLISKLYAPAEREKIEWGIGCILAGESINIQKFFVLYGSGGTGKSTILNIIQKLFEGYYSIFDAKSLCTSSNSFNTEMLSNNPLVLIQHDGDLSKLDDNTKFNTLVSNEEMVVNEKYKSQYTIKPIATLWIGTNSPVKITDSKSGLIRRLIDISPTGDVFKASEYDRLISKIDSEIGAIANHCLQVYLSCGKNFYAKYRPLSMIYNTNLFFNFVEQYYFTWKESDGVSLAQAYTMYKEYCLDSSVDYKLPRYKFREELKTYFREFHERARVENNHIRSYYQGFLTEKFESASGVEAKDSLELGCNESLFDKIAAEYPAQYATKTEIPEKPWEQVTTKLKDIDTSRLHYVKLPLNHIVIDFDLKQDGKKNVMLNLQEAGKWEPTYAEFSKGGSGVHLHYLYQGEVENLSRIHSAGIEIKVSVGNSSLRRKFTKANDLNITTLIGGLPQKEVKMLNNDTVKSEKGLRDLVKRNLQKEFHAGTKPSMDFIHKLLEDAYNSGMVYDLTDLRPKIMTFASNSSNQADYCLKLLPKMKFQSDLENENSMTYSDDTLIFFDVEVFPNLFVLVWKKEGGTPVRMINPTAKDIEPLLSFKLIGFNCRRYDNHILYARYIGYSIDEIYKQSQKIISNSPNAMFREAYNLSYTDIYDFSSEKKSLKKFEIELGIHHQELGLPWDHPVDESKWLLVAEYCENDVVATEAVFNARKQDWVARQILAKLSGLTPNDTTQKHTAQIIFGNVKTPQEDFIWTDLSKEFPGYEYKNGISTYLGEEVGEGGYVYAEPGMYPYTEILDVESMHPHSATYLNMFGPYTKKYEELVDARLAVKAGDFELAKTLLDGVLEPFLVNIADAPNLAYALKIVINIVYGLTSAKFPNPFKDPNNVDNICAKRGALFMIDLKHAVQLQGYTVAHIKTDSIKIPNAKKDIIEFVMEFGKDRGYKFKREKPYNRFCLVNESVYIAQDEKCNWEAVGAQFGHPYVFKTLFSHEEITFEDMCETKSVTTALYLDMNEMLGEDHEYRFVGKVGLFCPMLPGSGGGLLLREKDGKYHAATGSKGFRWMEAEMVKLLGLEDQIDQSYFARLCDDAIANISKFGDFNTFVQKRVAISDLPWAMPCGREHYSCCPECPDMVVDKSGYRCNLGYDIIPF